MKGLSGVLVLCFLGLSLVSCSKATFESSSSEGGNFVGGEETNGVGGIDSTLSFGGIDSITNETDSTLTINWTPHPDSISYDLFDMTSGTPVYRTNLNDPFATSVDLVNLTPGATYSFRVRVRNTQGLYDGNVNDVTVQMNLAPNSPSALSLHFPTTAIGSEPSPTIRVSGVKNGDTVRLFTDSTCTTQVAEGVANAATVDLTMTAPLADGIYNFYANSHGAHPSVCSTATVSYTLLSCPLGYLPVPPNPAVGTHDIFCVAKYEMRNVGGVATSTAAGVPWGGVSQQTARDACSDIDGSGKYYLISNPEWMTVARNIESVDANWNTGIPGVGAINRGHTDNNPANALASSTDDDPYSGTGNHAGEAPGFGWEQKRTHVLSNGGVIWDLSGNYWEWTDWFVADVDRAWVSGDGGLSGGVRSYSLVDMNIAGVMVPSTWEPLFPAGTNIGSYTSGNMGWGGGAIRGAPFFWDQGGAAGIFTLSLAQDVGADWADFGFRCVFRH